MSQKKVSAGKDCYKQWKEFSEDLLRQPHPDRGLLYTSSIAVSIKYPKLAEKLKERFKEIPPIKIERL